MNAERRAAIEAAGAVEIDAARFFNLDDAQAKVAEMRAALARELRRCRAEKGLTQRGMAKLLGMPQSRLSLVEKGDVSIEALAETVVRAGGRLLDMSADRSPHGSGGRRRPRSFARPVRRPRFMARSKAKGAPAHA